jgi:hypothetical protein
MGIAQEHAPGLHQRFFAEPQTLLGTMVRATAAGAFNALKFTLGYTVDRMDRNDNRDTPGLVSRTTGMQKGTFSIDGYLIPSGTAGTAPDMQELFQSVFGTETIDPGVSVAYTLANTQAIQVLSLHRAAYPGGAGTVPVWMQSGVGAWVNECKISFSGAEEHKVSFSGGVQRVVETGRTTLNGAMVSSTTLIAATATGSLLMTDSIVQVAALTNTSTGYRVTVDTARPSFTIESAISADTASAVVPFAPTPTTAGVPVGGILTAFTFNGGSLDVISGEVVINKGLKPIEDQAGAAVVPDVIRGKRSVTGSFTIRLRADQMTALGLRRTNNFTALACSLVLGSVAGSITTITMPRCELEFSDVDFPEAEEATVTVPFTCLEESGTSANAITVTFT